MTKFVKKSEIESSWYEVDANNAVVGRLAAVVSKIIRGKNKTTYTPHMDHGDFVVVKNVEKIKFTGKKFKEKKYYRHTGHPGGIKETTPEAYTEKNKPGEILKLAVKRMLPGGPLAKKQLTKLKIYSGDKHPHSAQNLISLNVSFNALLKLAFDRSTSKAKNCATKFALSNKLVRCTNLIHTVELKILAILFSK